LERRPVHIPDVLADKEFTWKEAQRLGGFRSMLGVPMMREGNLIGVIAIWRSEVAPFSEKQIELVSTFADQAVIAIENVRLFNETKEALERQTATAEILKVIASSPTDVQPVFDVIVERAVKLCGARFGRVYRYDGALVQMVAGHGLSAGGLQQVNRVFPRPAADDTIVGRVILTRQPYFLKDVELDPALPELSRQMIKALQTRSQVTIPMLRADEPIGAITLGWDKPNGFDDRQVELLKTFADQAVIAIENVRLFNETKEALEQQTATSDVLQVISSSPTDIAPVYRTILDNVTRLCQANIAALFLYDGEFLTTAAHHNATPEFAKQLDTLRVRPSHDTPSRLAALERRVVHVEDALSDPTLALSPAHRQEGARTILSVPLLREGALVGVITVWRREARLFTDKQVALVKTFADQAVIAIENVRLFNETQEALARQEAAAQVLRSISESVSDTAPVFTAILDCCNRLIPSIDYVQVQLIEGSDRVRLVDHRFGQVRGAAPGKQDERKAELMAREAAHFPRPLAGSTLERALNQGRVVILADVLDGPDTPPATLVEAQRWGHSYSQINVPLMREGRCIGAIEAFRRQLGGFEAKESTLLESFADQAVIAIENVRLFNETKEALERQTATAEILKVIAGSPANVQPVLDAVAESAARLCGATDALILTVENEMLRRRAHFGPITSVSPLRPLTPGTPTGRAILERRTIHIEDMLVEIERGDYDEGRELQQRTGFRTLLSVPLMREGFVIGAISIRRLEVRPFTEKADRAGQDLRRPGRDRDRERAPVQRNEGGARAADGYQRHSSRDQQLAERPRSGVRRDPRQRDAPLRCALRRAESL
jgi:GAF domain-containing protein